MPHEELPGVDLIDEGIADLSRGVESVAALKSVPVDSALAAQYFEELEPNLYRYPAVDAVSFRRAVEAVFGST